MTRKNKNIAVIGGGHNGLICGSYLAKAGFKVDLYESRSEIGGMASTREITDGYTVPGGAHLLHQNDSGIQKSLQLKKHGLSYAVSGLKTVSVSYTHLTLPTKA